MIVGMEKFVADMDSLANMDLTRPTQKAVELVQSAAKLLVQVTSGELRESISTQVKKDGTGYIGRCFTNKAYATYVEFGTGPRGQQNHAGVSPDVPVVYRLSPWWIHESMIDKSLAERYHWFYIDTEDGRFYQCSGQPARPYLYPALDNNRDNIRDIYADYLSSQAGGRP